MTQEKLLSLEERRAKYSVPALEKALDELKHLTTFGHMDTALRKSDVRSRSS